MTSVTIADVKDAARQIAPYAVRTPLIESTRLNELAGGRVLLKLETLQRIGAFKFRGAYNKISRLTKATAPAGVVAVSSGNHAQGVADAAAIMGLKAVIVMPADAPALKIARTRALGAEALLYDRGQENREAMAAEIVARTGAVMVPPFDDPHVIAGQGTAGLELAEQARDLGAPPDIVLVPVSGGGLLSGVAVAVKSVFPDARVIAAEPAGFDDYGRSLASGQRERNRAQAGSICDALMAPQPGQITFPLAQAHGVTGVAVAEADIRKAVRFAYEALKLVVEPGGAVGLAAILSGAVRLDGRIAAVVLSGGNIDPKLFAEIITEH